MLWCPLNNIHLIKANILWENIGVPCALCFIPTDRNMKPLQPIWPVSPRNLESLIVCFSSAKVFAHSLEEEQRENVLPGPAPEVPVAIQIELENAPEVPVAIQIEVENADTQTDYFKSIQIEPWTSPLTELAQKYVGSKRDPRRSFSPIVPVQSPDLFFNTFEVMYIIVTIAFPPRRSVNHTRATIEFSL